MKPFAPDRGGGQPCSPTVEKVVSGQLCSGCGLCAGVSGGGITMDIDAAGFARPVVLGAPDASAEARIAAACPGARIAPWDGSDSPVHPYWGPVATVATGHACNDEIRHLGSSGGMLTALAIHALESGLVDGVIHVAMDKDQPLRTATRLSRSRAEVIAGTGSRYSPSSPLQSIDTWLDSGERYAFIGKPCDVSALRQLARIDARVDRTIVLMMSFFCGGIPSVRGSEAVVRAMGMDPSALSTFRYRGNGWPGKARAESHDGKAAEMRYAECWGDILSKHVQFRCKICPDAVGGVADIACADAWYGGESGYPKFEEQEGRSLVITRTATGMAMLDNAVAAGACVTDSLDIGEVDLMQPSQARRKRLVLARTLACSVAVQPVPVMSGLAIGVAARRAGPVDFIRNFLGTLRRILRSQR